MSQTIHASSGSIRALKGVPASFRIAALLLLRTEKGQLTFRLPDGRCLVLENEEEGPSALIEIHDFDFVRRAMAGGDVGFADAYIEGMWSTPDLTEVLRFFSANFEAAGKLARGGWIVRSMNMLRHLFARRNSKQGARKNIIAHYDLGNAFYEQWLDESMTYSSALFENPNQSLYQGQQNKYRGICERMGWICRICGKPERRARHLPDNLSGPA
jgi:cyclopropane-fatty-acyl-phospholipid synthase